MKVCDTRKLTDYKHLNLISVRYTDRYGKEKSWVYASRGNADSPDAVVVVPIHKQENKLVLIREFRVPLEDYQYGFPAGLVDPGERIDQAGARELFEETGLNVTRVFRQSPPIFSSSGMTDESISLLYVECDGTPGSDNNEASEDIEVLMLDRDGVRRLLDRQDVLFDVKTWIVADRFAATGQVL